MNPKGPRNLFRSRGCRRSLGEERYIPKTAELAQRIKCVIQRDQRGVTQSPREWNLRRLSRPDWP